MTTLNRFERSTDAATKARAITSDRSGTKEAPLEGMVLAASGNCARLFNLRPADYGTRDGNNRRGTEGIPNDLETGVQGRTRARRGTALRLTTYRALRPACKTSTVGEENRRVA